MVLDDGDGVLVRLVREPGGRFSDCVAWREEGKGERGGEMRVEDCAEAEEESKEQERDVGRRRHPRSLLVEKRVVRQLLALN